MLLTGFRGGKWGPWGSEGPLPLLKKGEARPAAASRIQPHFSYKGEGGESEKPLLKAGEFRQKQQPRREAAGRENIIRR